MPDGVSGRLGWGEGRGVGAVVLVPGGSQAFQDDATAVVLPDVLLLGQEFGGMGDSRWFFSMTRVLV